MHKQHGRIDTTLNTRFNLMPRRKCMTEDKKLISHRQRKCLIDEKQKQK